MTHKKIGLALGGGGAKGFAHIGVLKVLEENGIHIDFISGTSMGAVIGAIYAAQPDIKKVEKQILKINWKNLFDYTLPISGLVKGTKIEKMIKDGIGDLKFSQLKIPLFVTSFDIKKNQGVIFDKGDVIKAVRASISLPGFFVPVENQGRILVDGMVTDIIPIDILRERGADIIIAVNVASVNEKKFLKTDKATKRDSSKKLPGILTTFLKSFQVIESQACKSELEREKADWVITPNLEKIGILDYSTENVKEAIKIGERETYRALKDKKILKKLSLKRIDHKG